LTSLNLNVILILSEKQRFGNWQWRQSTKRQRRIEVLGVIGGVVIVVSLALFVGAAFSAAAAANFFDKEEKKK
jgi:hypothetical protein